MTLPTRVIGRPATLARWDPFREIEDVWTRMGSLLGDVVGAETRPYGPLAAVTLPADVEETDQEFVVDVDLPGVKREDLSIDLRENDLYISGDVKEKERTGALRRQTRRFGRFEHQISLPGEVDPESVSATLRDGVLCVRLTKARRSEARHIEITES